MTHATGEEHNNKLIWYTCHLCFKIEDLTETLKLFTEAFEILLEKMDELIEATTPGPG